MSNISEYCHNVSLRLSHVLKEIGVNENIVMKRRRLYLLQESTSTIFQQIQDRDINVYRFGSQIEGTTTLGLRSDSDCLFTDNNFNVIQNWSEWEHGKRNVLMIHDDIVSPGYCFLQILRDDVPLPAIYDINQDSYRDSVGRILMKNSFSYTNRVTAVRHGPAHTFEGVPGVYDVDLVLAYNCKSWPVQACSWFDQLSENHWPTHGMREFCRNSGCFVVGVGRKGSVNEYLEWRISTSQAERCLMFNLNITQIRCYVLMKMIIKTFIASQCPDSISSFMCKTVLLHCISNTRIDAWKENTLLTCFTFCLSTLYNCVLNEYCPHFMIPGNNLMAGRFSPEIKQIILQNILYVVRSNGCALLQIQYDSLGSRIQNTFILNVAIIPDGMSTFISGHLLKNTFLEISSAYENVLIPANDIHDKHVLIVMLRNFMSKLLHLYDRNERKVMVACVVLARYLGITLGSILASNDIYNHGTVRIEALTMISFGLNCDVAFGKLKLASIFYCTGDIERTEVILKNIEENYDLTVVEPVCGCYDFQQSLRRRTFDQLCYEENDDYTLLCRSSASCVRFLRAEIHCCPQELRHEMFRSTLDDIHYRRYDYNWMDMAVIDSLAYLYFLQYKVYSRLGRHNDKQRALSNLARCIVQEPNFGHKETALNLLGQCMEQENRIDVAFKYYLLSLKVLNRNNAAKFHICRLISSLVRNQAN